MAASRFMTKMLIFAVTIFVSLQQFYVSPFEFEVGGTFGWIVPPTNETRTYNDWASGYRFKTGDAIHFKYKKDSVMEVTKADYNKCNSSYPNFFSNRGNTVYHFNHSGPFYFISGMSGHCERGQKMIVKVVNADETAAYSGGDGHKSDGGSPVSVSVFGVSTIVVVLHFVSSYVLSSHA